MIWGSLEREREPSTLEISCITRTALRQELQCRFPIHTKYLPALNSFWIPHSRALRGGNCFGWSSAGAGGIHQLQVILLLLAPRQFLDFSQFVFSGEGGIGREQTSPQWCLTASQASRLPLPSWQLWAHCRRHSAFRRWMPLPAWASGLLVLPSSAARAHRLWHSCHFKLQTILQARCEHCGGGRKRGEEQGLSWGVSDLSADGLASIGAFPRAPNTFLFPASVLPDLQSVCACSCLQNQKLQLENFWAYCYYWTNTSVITFNVIFHQIKESRIWILQVWQCN